MKYYRVICNTDSAYVKAILGVTQDDVLYGTDIDRKIIDIPDLDAYRTGLENLKKAMKPRECYLREYWPDQGKPLDVTDPQFIFTTKSFGTTKGCWEMIEKKHIEGDKLYTYMNNVNFYGQYRVIFGTDGIIYLRYKRDKFIKDIPVKEILKPDFEIPDDFVSKYADHKKTLDLLQVILECFLKTP